MRNLVMAMSFVLGGCLSGQLKGPGPSADPADPVGPGGPIVVLWSLDTLGATAARETAWCERIGELLAERGLDVACPEGGVSPASWTAETHTRMLWPSQRIGDLRASIYPREGEPSVHRTVGDAIGGRVIWAPDNGVLESQGYYEGSDSIYESAGEPWLVPEARRPGNLGMDELLETTADGYPAVVILNSLEVGGHIPRCWFAPDTADCERLWLLALENDAVQPQDPSAEPFADMTWWRSLEDWVSDEVAFEDPTIGLAFWATMIQAIDHHRAEKFEDRLSRLLAGLEEQGRLDDLVLVAFSDHGEAPCVPKPVGDGTMTCSHGGLPNAFTVNVPVFVSPAALASTWEEQGWVGDVDSPWSTANLAWGIADAVDAPIPEEWGAPEPVGTATTWNCHKEFIDEARYGATGARIEGDAVVRCQGQDCVAEVWEIPAGPEDRPRELTVVPPSLQPWMEDDWFLEACEYR